MGAHMKTTIDLADELLSEARTLAHEQNKTLRALVEEGLRCVLRRHRSDRRQPFRLGDESVAGEGVREGVKEGRWFDDDVSPSIYDGRGS